MGKKRLLSFSRPTAFTPFFRRFTNERVREVKELQKLYERVVALHEKANINVPKIATDIVLAIDYPPSMFGTVWECITNLITQCDELYRPDEPDWETLSIEQSAELRNKLYTQEAFLLKTNLSIIKQTIIDAIQCAVVEAKDGFFTAPLYTFDPDMVQNVTRPFYRNEVLDNYLFLKLRDTVRENIKEDPEDISIVSLGWTPLWDLLQTPHPLPVPEDTFFSHMHVLGGSGAGKTSLLVQIMLHHFKTDATVILVDSQGDLIPRLRTLASIQSRLVYIDPVNPPKIDLFKNATIETIMYLCSMLDADMSGKQAIFFKMMAHLLMKMPHATLLDFLKIMDDLSPFEQYLEELTEIQKDFFKKDFCSKNFAQTREQVKYRLQGILENPTIEKLFTGNNPILDLGDKMDSGNIILIDTNKDYLKSSSPVFGRIFIAIILQEVYARANKKRHPTYLIIDEVQEVLDSNIDGFLTQARKYKCGLVLAHQNLDQAAKPLQASLSSNTAIKMVAGLSTTDAKKLAPDMRTSADYILSLPRLTFATYIRNVTSAAIPFTVTPGLLDREEHVELEDIPDELEPENLLQDEPLEEAQEELLEEPQEVPVESKHSSSQESPQDNIDTSASENW